MRRGLVNARIEGLIVQGEWIVHLIDDAATVGEPEPALQASAAATASGSGCSTRTAG
jgi:two-component system sensor histidine kinase ChvG